MTNIRLGPKLALGTLLLALPLLLQTRSALASDWGFSFGFGWSHPQPVVVAAPSPAVVRQWVPEHYETRTERVLVENAHYERQWVPAPAYTVYERWGATYTVPARSGYWTKVYIPARYETRTVSVLVPGYYREIVVDTPQYYGYPWRGGVVCR